MGRSPCCDKVNLKKGPWTVEEDQKLLAYVEKHGHGSWRALPAKAGEPPELSSPRLRKSVVEESCDASCNCRTAEVWEELPVEMDQLPSTGHQKGGV